MYHFCLWPRTLILNVLALYGGYSNKRFSDYLIFVQNPTKLVFHEMKCVLWMYAWLTRWRNLILQGGVTKAQCIFLTQSEFSKLYFVSKIVMTYQEKKMVLKSVHFKNSVTRSSFHSKLWPFSITHQLTLFWFVLKMVIVLSEMRIA